VIASDDEDDENDFDSASDKGKEWDEKCYLCGKKGEVILCEGDNCTHVAHVACAGLKKKPTGDWYCENCLVK
jgi:trehalose-6-phosphatase